MKMELISILTGKFSSYLSFLFGMIFAEETIILNSFLFSQKLTSIYNILISFIGVIFSNISLYLMGRFKLIEPLKKSKKIVVLSKKIESGMNKLTKNKIEKSMIYSKFIVTSRFFMAMLIGYRKINFYKFLKNMLMAELFWAVIAISIGLFAGESFTVLTRAFKSLTLIGTLFVLLSGLMIYIKKRVIKRRI